MTSTQPAEREMMAEAYVAKLEREQREMEKFAEYVKKANLSDLKRTRKAQAKKQEKVRKACLKALRAEMNLPRTVRAELKSLQLHGEYAVSATYSVAGVIFDVQAELLWLRGHLVHTVSARKLKVTANGQPIHTAEDLLQVIS